MRSFHLKHPNHVRTSAKQIKSHFISAILIKNNIWITYRIQDQIMTWSFVCGCRCCGCRHRHRFQGLESERSHYFWNSSIKNDGQRWTCLLWWKCTLYYSVSNILLTKYVLSMWNSTTDVPLYTAINFYLLFQLVK